MNKCTQSPRQLFLCCATFGVLNCAYMRLKVIPLYRPMFAYQMYKHSGYYHNFKANGREWWEYKPIHLFISYLSVGAKSF